MHNHCKAGTRFSLESVNYRLNYKILSFHREYHQSNVAWNTFCEMLHYSDHQLITNIKALQALMPEKMQTSWY